MKSHSSPIIFVNTALADCIFAYHRFKSFLYLRNVYFHGTEFSSGNHPVMSRTSIGG